MLDWLGKFWRRQQFGHGLTPVEGIPPVSRAHGLPLAAIVQRPDSTDVLLSFSIDINGDTPQPWFSPYSILGDLCDSLELFCQKCLDAVFVKQHKTFLDQALFNKPFLELKLSRFSLAPSNLSIMAYSDRSNRRCLISFAKGPYVDLEDFREWVKDLRRMVTDAHAVLRGNSPK